MAVQTNAIDDKTLFEAQKKAASLQEAEQIGAIRLRFANDRLRAAANSFIEGSFAYLDLIEQLEKGIRQIGHAPELVDLLDKAREFQISLHDAQRSRAVGAGDARLKQDEVQKPVDIGKPRDTTPKVTPITSPPKTLKTTSFTPALAAEYERLFLGCSIREDREHLVARNAKVALDNRSRYENIGQQLRIPWWFIAAIHMLESEFNFGAHLHNGDSLKARTRNEPRGQPETGAPPFTWEESALDALKDEDFDGQTDWSLARALYRWERYNGVGYRPLQIPSPYLWSFSRTYGKGKFVRDGVFDPAAGSEQCGAGVLLKYLNQRGDVKLDFDDQEEGAAFDVAADIQNGFLDSDVTTDLSPFAAFWRQNLPEIMHFKPKEFLYKGASHERNGLNTDPPETLWRNVIPLARVLDHIRAEINLPIKLLSIYRSPAYNRAVGGVGASQHTEFKAADFTVINTTTGPADWARVVHGLRSRNLFSGGVGVYPSQNFVHVDVRGFNANW